MKAKCKKCGDTVEVTRLREFKSCKCGAINLDYGDEFYYRVCGDPEDFDGEIEDVPKIKDLDDPNRYKVKSRQMGKQGAIAGSFVEREMDTANARMVDANLNNIATYLEELSDALEETSDLVSKISRLLMERSDKSEEFKNMMKGGQ